MGGWKLSWGLVEYKWGKKVFFGEVNESFKLESHNVLKAIVKMCNLDLLFTGIDSLSSSTLLSLGCHLNQHIELLDSHLWREIIERNEIRSEYKYRKLLLCLLKYKNLRKKSQMVIRYSTKSSSASNDQKQFPHWDIMNLSLLNAID